MASRAPKPTVCLLLPDERSNYDVADSQTDYKTFHACIDSELALSSLSIVNRTSCMIHHVKSSYAMLNGEQNTIGVTDRYHLAATMMQGTNTCLKTRMIPTITENTWHTTSPRLRRMHLKPPISSNSSGCRCSNPQPRPSSDRLQAG